MDDLTALTIAAELGDPRRFPTAPSTMAYVGLVPSEHSSGAKRARGAITKTGNAHLRRVLVEAAWHYRHQAVCRGRAAAAATGRAARRSLPKRGARSAAASAVPRLAARGKPSQRSITAVARELTGFVWAALTRDLIG